MYQLLTFFTSILTFTSLTLPAVTMVNTMHLAQNHNCSNPQTQLEINRCTNLAYQNADKKLNQAYQQLLPRLSGARRQKLIVSQQAWIKFRDTNCEFERSGYEGGSITPTIYFACLKITTQQRTQQLLEYLNLER
jgi:uncharacterized protein YecT (DUF1311 family)